MSIKEKILNAQDLKTQDVEVPEWDVTVTIKEMDAETFQSMHGISERENRLASVLVNCIVDESGNTIFTEEDIDALGHKNHYVLDRLTDVVLSLSNLSEYAGPELEKN